MQKPTKKLLFYNLGNLNFLNGDSESALQNYKNSLLDSKPDFKADALYNMGYLNLVDFDNLDLAIEFFTKVLKLDDQRFSAYYNLGYSYELLGNTKSAESNYRLALSINPQYDSAAKGLSRIGF